MDLFSLQMQDAPTNKLGMVNAEVEYYPSFFSKRESDKFYKILLENILWQQDYITFYGKTMPIPRLTAWYGETDKPYTYSGIPMKPHFWSSELLDIKNRIEEKAGVKFTSVLINQYRTGNDSVAWHADDEPELGKNPIIGSVSFGATRSFQFKHKEHPELKEKIELQHGSFLLMKGETQHHWLHQIPKTSKQLPPRINLTFRIIK